MRKKNRLRQVLHLCQVWGLIFGKGREGAKDILPLRCEKRNLQPGPSFTFTPHHFPFNFVTRATKFKSSEKRILRITYFVFYFRIFKDLIHKICMKNEMLCLKGIVHFYDFSVIGGMFLSLSHNEITIINLYLNRLM